MPVPHGQKCVDTEIDTSIYYLRILSPLQVLGTIGMLCTSVILSRSVQQPTFVSLGTR